MSSILPCPPYLPQVMQAKGGLQGGGLGCGVQRRGMGSGGLREGVGEGAGDI